VSFWLSPAACPAGSSASSPELDVPAPPPPAKGWIAILQICLGCFVLDSGPRCKDLYLGFITVHSSALENFQKFVEKSEKYQTNFVGFRRRNPTTFVILTWLDSK
jgi:hypothetical protein